MKPPLMANYLQRPLLWWTQSSHWLPLKSLYNGHSFSSVSKVAIKKNLNCNCLTINEWGWASYEELRRSRRVLSRSQQITLSEMSIIFHKMRSQI